nr:class I SAM-dependent methyltransferase [uncultured Carboxylicivirga sp.]
MDNNPEFLKTLAIFIPLIIAAISLAFNVRKNIKEFKYNLQLLEEQKITDKRKEIGRKLNEFYGPFIQNLKKSSTLYRALLENKENKKEFRLLDIFLVEEKRNTLSDNDWVLIKEIIQIGKNQQKLIEEKGGLIDDPTLCNYYVDLKSMDKYPFDRRDLHNIGLIPRVNAHYRILYLAYKRKLKGDPERFRDYVFPRWLSMEVERRIFELQNELAMLRSIPKKISYKKELSETISSYDNYASEYDTNVRNIYNEYYESFILKLKESFPNLSEKQINILDLGCGSGRDIDFFYKKGFNITGIDKSKKLIKIARKKLQNVTILNEDILNFNTIGKKYNGIWINASLLHIPKIYIRSVLLNVVKSLEINGIVYISLKEGFGEHFEPDKRYNDAMKFWAFYTEFEIINNLENIGMEILNSNIEKKNTTYSTHPWINILAKKK